MQTLPLLSAEKFQSPCPLYWKASVLERNTDGWIFTTPNSEKSIPKSPKLFQRENRGRKIRRRWSGFAADKRRLPLSMVVADCVERWFEDVLKEARAGDINMQVLVGQMYYSGYGVPKNAGKGSLWFTRTSRVRSTVWGVIGKRPAPPLRAVNKASVCREVPNPASVHQEFSTAASVFSAPPQRAVNTFGSSPRFHPSVKFQPPLQSGVKLQSPPLLNTLVFPSASATGTADTETSAMLGVQIIFFSGIACFTIVDKQFVFLTIVTPTWTIYIVFGTSADSGPDSIVGRAVVIHADPDDPGRGEFMCSMYFPG
ncbi:superoxide dismutase [Striga asiatica]|uniref:Superoxide dismutase n=1 Tax=Striga asiatica TaxID=4170 RepID=A0A5A7P609_STRAF|nr:superoxide dismutase [Striga asiatica]